MKSKVCNACGIIMSMAFFHKDASSEDGHARKCKKCIGAYQKGRGHENSPPTDWSKTHKICTKCGVCKPLIDFSSQKRSKEPRRTLNRRSICIDCDSERDYYYRIEKKYGFLREDHDALFEEQQGCCVICQTHQDELNKRLCVDHNPETGEIRGLLCDSCNRGIGLLGDTEERIDRAVWYLTRVPPAQK